MKENIILDKSFAFSVPNDINELIKMLTSIIKTTQERRMK